LLNIIPYKITLSGKIEMSILVIADHDNNALKSGVTATVACAQKIGGEIHVLVAGNHCSAAATAAAMLFGVTKVLVADAPHLGSAVAENLAPLVVGLAKNYSHVLVPASALARMHGMEPSQFVIPMSFWLFQHWNHAKIPNC
jgi:electron transfer flavoprotein alpha subunit